MGASASQRNRPGPLPQCCGRVESRPGEIPEWAPYSKSNLPHGKLSEVADEPADAQSYDVLPTELNAVEQEPSITRPVKTLALKCRVSISPISGISYFDIETPDTTAPGVSTTGHGMLYDSKTAAVYVGQWKGSVRHGFGEQTWSDGARFVGCWHKNLPEGPGKLVHADGDMFVGQWRRGMADGLGIYYVRNCSTTYWGEWHQDLQHGYGVEDFANESQYTGQFQNGKKQGVGVCCWSDGSTFEGHWRNNQISGHGFWVDGDGRTIRGSWRCSSINGCAEYCWPEGSTYRGQYVEDQKQGFGILTSADGRRFEGFWHHGKADGHGITYTANGSVARDCFWRNGKCTKKQPLRNIRPAGTLCKSDSSDALGIRKSDARGVYLTRI